MKHSLKISVLAVMAMLLAGCEAYHETRDAYENAFASPEFLKLKDACDKGNIQACAAVEQVRAQRAATSASAQSEFFSNDASSYGYRQARNRDMVLQHGAGGCTPNFSTGGCL